MTASDDRRDREHDDERHRRPLGAHLAQEPPGGPAEVHRLLAGHAHAHHRAAAARAAPDRRDALRRLLRAHAASSTLTCEYTISRYVSDDSSSSACVPTPTTSPSSITTMLSACRMVATRCAIDQHGRLPRLRDQRRPQPRVGRVVERGERVVEQVDVRPSDQGPARWRAVAAGRRTRWCRPARSARRGPRRAPRRSRAPARPRARATAPRRSRPAGRTRGWTARCRRTGTASAGRARSGSTAGPGSSARTSTPSMSTSPPVTSNSRGIRLSSVVLPAPGGADDRGGPARLGHQVDAVQDRPLGARVAELDAAQLEQPGPRLGAGPQRARAARAGRRRCGCPAPRRCARRTRRPAGPSRTSSSTSSRP